MGKTTTAKATVSDEDFSEFLELLKLTGENVDDLTAEQERNLQNRCWTWIKNNKPKAVMPPMTVKVTQILKVYREKRLGKQYIFWRDQDGVQGKEFTHTYEQVPEILEGKPTGKMLDGKILTTTEKHLEEYTKPRGEELVEQALKTAINPTFYFVHSKGVGGKIKVDADDFNTDFDAIVKSTMQSVSNNRK